MSRRRGNPQNCEEAAKKLSAAGIRFTVHNEGHHLKLPDLGVDFWPSTLKWLKKGVYREGVSLRDVLHIFEHMQMSISKNYKSARTEGVGGPFYDGDVPPWAPYTGPKFHWFTPEQARRYARKHGQ